MTTPILSIPEVANNQVDQYATVNEALRDLEAAGNDVFDIDMSSADAEITNISPDFVFSRYAVFRSVGNAVPRVLTVPAAKRLFVVWNSGSADITVTRGASSVIVSSESAIVFYADGTASGLVALSGGGSGSVSRVTQMLSSGGVLDLSSVDTDTVTVVLFEDVNSILLPPGMAGKRRDLIIRFEQDDTGGWDVDLSDILWDGDGSPAIIDPSAESRTYILLTNINAEQWEGFK